MSNQLFELQNIIYNDESSDHLLNTMTVLAGTMMDTLNKLPHFEVKTKIVVLTELLTKVAQTAAMAGIDAMEQMQQQQAALLAAQQQKKKNIVSNAFTEALSKLEQQGLVSRQGVVSTDNPGSSSGASRKRHERASGKAKKRQKSKRRR